MENIVRSVSSDFSSHSAGQPPIVLARLPHVGAEAPASPVHIQPVPPPEAMPRLDLHTEIARRTRLHLADTPADHLRSKTSHFAEGGHTVLQPSQPGPSQQPATRQSTVGKPMTLSEQLFHLHSQLSPHAGLIVALALIASAGLLYWMIVGPAQAPMPNYENRSTEFFDEGFGSISNYTPEFVAAVPQSAAPQRSDDQWNELLRTEVPQVEQGSIPLAEPEAQPESQPESSSTSLQEISKTDKPLFPQTDYRELDFSKLQPMHSSQPTPDSPQSLPPVAGRPNTTTTR